MPPSNETIRLVGFKDYMRDTAKAEKDTKKVVNKRLAVAGEIVREEGARRFVDINPKSASKFRVSVRQTGIYVQQGLRKTTGLRSDYGSLQMTRALLPALQEKEGEVRGEMVKAADELADIMEGRTSF